jgi:hypothetical protein
MCQQEKGFIRASDPCHFSVIPAVSAPDKPLPQRYNPDFLIGAVFVEPGDNEPAFPSASASIGNGSSQIVFLTSPALCRIMMILRAVKGMKQWLIS